MSEDYIVQVFKTAIKYNIITVEEIHLLSDLDDNEFADKFNVVVREVLNVLRIRKDAINVSMLALGPERADEYVKEFGVLEFELNAIEAYKELDNRMK